MNAYTMRIQDSMRIETIAGVTSFVGEDISGSFGVLADHARFMTSLVTGLARFRVGDGAWQYLAVPGALLYFHDNVLTLNTRRFLLDDDYMRISDALEQQLLVEEDRLRATKSGLQQMEEAIFRRLWELDRKAVG